MSFYSANALQALQSSMDSILRTTSMACSAKSLIIPLDISETATHFIVEADVPGVSKGNIKVTMKSNRVLTIAYERIGDGNKLDFTAYLNSIKPECKTDSPVANQDIETKPQFHVANLKYGKFSRSFTFPVTADFAAVTSSLENGVLTVRIAKKPVEVNEVIID